jgi:tRNA-dihydrouridine synthase B
MSTPLSSLLASPRAHLAPMLGTADIPFRRLCRRYGAGLVFTEMVSAKGVLAQATDSWKHAAFDREERPVALQLVASSPETVEAAVRELLPLKPDAIDVNCGCPDEQICDAGAGASLLDDLPRLGRVLRTVVRAAGVPVTAKVRAGGLHRSSTVADIARTVEDAGVALLTVHARGRATRYDQPADWRYITEAVQAVSIPVIGNGDVFSSADARRLREESGCAGVMIGRGSLGSPWIFRDVEEDRNCGLLDHAPEGDALRALVREHLDMILREYGPVLSVSRMRKHALWYLRFFDGLEQMRHELFAQERPAALLETVDRCFDARPRRLDPDDEAYRDIDALFRRRVLYWVDFVSLNL